MPRTEDFDRLHANDTAASRGWRGVQDGGRGGRSEGPTGWSPGADALFRQVLDGIVDTGLVEYAASTGPQRDAGRRIRGCEDASGKWSFSKFAAKVTADMRKEAEATPGVGQYTVEDGIGRRRAGGVLAWKPPKDAKKTGKPVASGEPAKARNPADPPAPAADRAITKRSPSPVTMRPPTAASKKTPEPPTPGPGAYDETATPFQPSAVGPATIGKARRALKETTNTPGPAAYQLPKPVLAGGKWRKPPGSAASAKNLPAKPQVPGPGAYDVAPPPADKDKKTAPGNERALMGTAATGRLPSPAPTEAVPGPGAYAVSGSDLGAAARAVFGKAKRPVALKAKLDDQPGPGSYAAERANAMGDAYHRVKGVLAFRVPADASKAKGALAPAAARSSSLPGPGTYATPPVNSWGDRGVAFSAEPRKSTEKAPASATPGPGAYATARLDVSAAHRSSSAPVFGSAPKDDGAGRRAKAAAALPGPGAYGADRDAVLPAAQAVGIGTQPRDTNFGSRAEAKWARTVPGPGAYEAAGGAAARSYSIGTAPTGRGEQGAKPAAGNTPGPGAYDVADFSFACDAAADGRRSAGGVIGTAERGVAMEEWLHAHAGASYVPGPGAYDACTLTDERPRGVVMGTELRSFHDGGAHRSSTPGPGAYLAVDDADASAAGRGAFMPTEERRLFVKPSSDHPGPGAYDVGRCACSGCVHTCGGIYGPSFPQDARFRVEGGADAAPGPGQYDVKRLHDGYAEGHSVVFATAERGSGRSPEEDVPGPGAYFDSTLDVSAIAGFTFPKARPSDRSAIDNAPGPGAYDSSLLPLTKIQSAVVGTERRGLSFTNDGAADNPGPGAYDSAVDHNAASFTIGARYPTPVPDAVRNPGPGAYASEAASRHRSPPNAVFGTAARAASPREIPAGPGPGAYEAEIERSIVGGVIGERPPPGGSAAPGPGPGAYDVAHGGHSAGTVFGTAARGPAAGERSEKNDVPGPGAYGSEPERWWGGGEGRGGVIAATGRDGRGGDDTPGPGAYADGGCALGTRGAVLDAREARFFDAGGGCATPGPGAYAAAEHTSLQERPAAIIFARHETPSAAHSQPGPGAYDVPSALDTAHGAVLGTSLRTAPSGPPRETPGPGHYEPPAARGGPAVSISNKIDVVVRRDAGPGPGAYDVSEVDPLRKGGVIGTSPRRSGVFTGDDEQTPGPGHYEIPGCGSKVSAVILGRPVDSKLAAQSPGPGAYDVAVAQPAETSAQAGVTIPRSGRMPPEGDHGASPTPGPGAYDTLQAHVDEVCMVTIGTRHAAPRFEDTPGPGHYAETLPGERVKGGVIGSQQRQQESAADDTPGPGQYDVSGQAKDGDTSLGAYIGSDGTRFAMSFRDDVPGPGAYNVVPASMEGRAFSMGGLLPAKEAASDVPGPGSYEVLPRMAGPDGAAFPRAGRLVNVAFDDMTQPGPGYYETRPPEGGPKFTIGTRHIDNSSSLLQADALPGPGSYNVPPSRSAPSVTIGHALNPTGGFGLVDDTPGPGQYEVAVRLESDKNRGVTIGRRHDSLAEGQAATGPDVGPGSYQAKSLHTGPVVTMGQKTDGQFALDASNANLVGPGAYYRPEQPGSHAPAYSFGSQSERLDLVASRGLPGPGQYHQSIPFGAGAPSCSIQSAKPAAMASDDPGPGQYHSDRGMLGTDSAAPAVVISKPRRCPAPRPPSPGPGQYHKPAAFGAEAPKASLSHPAPSRQPDVVPGPGAYHSAAHPGANAPKPVISKPSKGPRAVRATPGPGEYDADSKQPLTGRFTRAPTIGRKRHDRPADPTPAPGDYGYSSVPLGAGAPAVHIAPPRAAPSAQSHQTSTVGPGQYNPKMPGGPAVSIGERRRDRPRDPTPGPGQYEAPSTQSAAPAVHISPPRAVSSADPRPTVGPGQYYPKLSGGPAVSIGERRRDRQRDLTPGPGQYEAPSTRDARRNNTGGFGRTGRFETRKRSETPGHGAYRSAPRSSSRS
ncbi:Sperm-tail PG-rich repeat [Diplonema papillatum]|nr:Sperm-tail PG-rich repeat [Diplonema papillatum]